MDFSPEQLRRALLSLVAFIMSVSVHEFGHAWMADRLGDRLPRAQGRLTLSPLAHIDLVGTILVPLLAAFMPGNFPMVAWGKPVQTNPTNYTRRLPARQGHMLVAVMGPFMNLLLAVLLTLVFVAITKSRGMSPEHAALFIDNLITLNIVLLFFNLIPLPPLDGGTVLAGLLPESLQAIPRVLQRYGMILFFILLLSGGFRYLMRPAYHVVEVWGSALMRLVVP
jgi:Zn-dependent protease